MSATANLPALPSSLTPEGNLSRYLQEIRKFPLLEPQQEFMLAKRWREHGDSKAAHQLVTSHLRLVAKIAMGYRGYGLPVAELISEGNVGMMQAVKRFDPDRGFRLATYAMWWIRASIQEYILHSWSLVKMGTTAAQKKLFFNLRKLKGQMQAIEEGDLSPEQVKKIATRLGVPEEEVVNMNRRLAAPDSSLNAPVKAEGDMEWQDWLVDESPNQETKLGESQEMGQRKQMLAGALKQLTDRERHIIVERRLIDEPKTLEDLSSKYGISRERVRQIEVRAFDKLQKAMKNMVVEAATELSKKVEARGKVEAHGARWRTDPLEEAVDFPGRRIGRLVVNEVAGILRDAGLDVFEVLAHHVDPLAQQHRIVPAPQHARGLDDLGWLGRGAGHDSQPAGILRDVPVEAALEIARAHEVVDPALQHGVEGILAVRPVL